MGNNVKLYGGVDTRNTPGLVPGAGHDDGGSAEAGWRACLSLDGPPRLPSPFMGARNKSGHDGKMAGVAPPHVMPGLVPGTHAAFDWQRRASTFNDQSTTNAM